ncbi:MAG: beta-phosphoglucomutase [Propionibacteriaceae bacterium]|jgi:beta-phosphoglucomutase|nr:beta-phosphoglucomutase [Propionibacteriaceae bacterium]
MGWIVLGREIQGVIFDLDGVLCSTDEFHYLAWKATADELGVPFDRDSNNRLRGVSRMESLELILEGRGGDTSLSLAEKLHIADEKNARYRDSLSSLTPDDTSIEVVATLNALRTRGLKLAIGSSSKNTPLILERLALTPYFDAIADGNMIQRSKPDPEVFTLAAAKLGLSPMNCLVVEDAVSGAEAAHAGGFLAVCVGDAATKQAGDVNLTTLSGIVEL